MTPHPDWTTIEATLRRAALRYPGSTEDFPWGHRAFKVRGKAFAFLARSDDALSLSVKLPSSGMVALDLPFASPTGYGLGKAGWVTARFQPPDRVPSEILLEWIDESYRAIAPRRLAKRLDEQSPPAGDPSDGTDLLVKRVYLPPARDDGRRILIDRLWPRGLTRATAGIDYWARSIAPSDRLRQWYRHDPAKWSEFRRRYAIELDENPDGIGELLSQLDGDTTTLLFASKEERLNNAHALKAYLEGNE